ncbi:MAG TPA: AAA family ATPase [Candidatus Saccharimonadales bacterium]|nr:AAA family ATPase [Candidatus Saccharimonadales bacterium]
MHLKSLRVIGFKRFTDLTVDGLSSTARLTILAGPNGTGKSSFFDALKVWHAYNGGVHGGYDETYHRKFGVVSTTSWSETVKAEVFESLVELSPESRKKIVYIRSAHRNEADFALNGLNQMPPVLDAPRVTRTIDNDLSVSQNYQRLVLATLDSVYSDTLPGTTTRDEIRDSLIGKVRSALQAIYPELSLEGISTNPIIGGTFYFSKGTSKNFPYKNLSSGEKAVFDLLLDMVISGVAYNSTIWCIDEPETHLNVRVQAKLLEQLLTLLPDGCQLVLASHSLGFMRRAWEIAQSSPDEVQFLDFQDIDFDSQVHMTPTRPTRQFWDKTLDVALGDLASLVAPKQIVLCEGRPVTGKGQHGKGEFDARCYRTIFADEFPDTDFISLGNSDNVKNDKLELGKNIQTIVSGTKVISVVDRDLMSPAEVAELEADGTRALSRRHIESYLLDDEIITAFAAKYGCPAAGLLQKKADLLAASIGRGNDRDDLKSIAAEWHTTARKEANLKNSGSTWEAFAADFLAPLISSRTTAYQELKTSIFG